MTLTTYRRYISKFIYLSIYLSSIMGSVNDDTVTLLNIYYFRSDHIGFLGGFSQTADLTV